ncbi:Translation initiation factor IF-3 [Smittium mucronatum]|uniref:Translation initiation factor IF-3 n=1 Tax=Smittium mucronatum TaxID=133383 RepID=A0A1R0H850_9FUNG|nr:Translation initiation factor IF-3 [Smittium mucronatum]
MPSIICIKYPGVDIANSTPRIFRGALNFFTSKEIKTKSRPTLEKTFTSSFASQNHHHFLKSSNFLATTALRSNIRFKRLNIKSIIRFKSTSPQLQQRPLRNEEIRGDFIKLIDQDGKMIEAPVRLSDILLRLDRSKHVLQVVDPNSNPMLCRVFSKQYLYEREKQAKKSNVAKSPDSGKRRVGAVKLKNLQISANIGTHDLGVKLSRLEEFLKAGHRVQVKILRNSRNARLNDNTELLLETVMDKCSVISTVVSEPTKENNGVSVLFQGKQA